MGLADERRAGLGGNMSYFYTNDHLAFFLF